MAEERDPNYGQLSTPSLAKQAIEAKPEPAPKQVDGKPRSVDTQKLAGNPITGPNNKTGMSNKEAMIAKLNSAATDLYTEDKHQYNKLTTFNSSHTGHNFDRYYAHPKFKQLGFSPFRDNESYYNQNSSLWDDAIRGGITAGKLAWLGGTSTFKNWGSMFSTNGNTEDADEMERLMSVGSSSRKGFGAKAINFGVNMGYTYGVVGEILAEEGALFLAGTAGAAFTGGTSTAVAIARTGVNLKRLTKAFEAFKGLSTITKAREIWNSSKGLQSVGKLAGHLAPFEEARSLFTASGRAAAKWGELSDMAKVSKSFGSFYKGLREINAVTSEARLEGGGTQSEVTNALMAQFKKDKGRDPDDKEAEAIFKQAHQAGVTSTLMNSAGIYLSNKVVLERALKGVSGMELGAMASRKIKGSFLLTAGWKALNKEPYELVKGFKQLGRAAFYKQTFNPKNLVKGGLGYVSANLMEGVQEVYQEAVSKGLSDYYISTYNDPSRVGSAEFQTKLLHGLKSQGSEQGLETFLSGFLMAGPMGAMQSAFYGGVDMIKAKQLKANAEAFTANPENAGKENPYQRELDRQADFENKTLEALNEVTKDPAKYFSALERDIKIQNDLARAADAAAADGDVKAVKDARDASLVNHTLALLQAGKFDVFEEQLKSLSELSISELQDAFDEDPSATTKTVSERLKNVMGRVKEIKSSFEEYQNMINPHTMEKNPMGYLSFEHAREVMIHDDIRYKRTGQRMADLYTEFSANLPFENANGADFANLFSIGDPNSLSTIGREGMRSEIELLNKEIEVAEAGDATSKLRAEKLKKKRDSLSSLSALVQLYKSQYTVNQSINHTDESFAKNEKALADLDIQLRDSFNEHIKVLAEQNGKHVLTKNLDKAYKQFSDYWKLNSDQGQMANSLNALHDPYIFNQAIGRLETAMRTAIAQRKEKLKEALKEFQARKHKNKFFNDLFDNFNAFIDPEEADAYISDNEVPTTFFDADTMEEIQPGSEKYKGIMALVDEYDEAYFEKEGKRMIRTGTGGLMSFRGKEESDKRTIKQLGEEYGFDHTDVLSYVNIEQVLKTIMSSKFASKDMKKLAQALLSIVDKNTQITFKTNHFTNSTYDATNGIIVDPRFSSEGFTNGYVPMEFSILNGIMQQLMDKSLEDPEFNDKMTVLREKFTENLTDEQKKEFGLAMKDNAGFVAEVMTNPSVQGILDAIPLEGEATAQTAEAKTLWQSFLDEVKALLEKLFGTKRSATLYDEAITVITNKLSQPGVKLADVVEEETFDTPTEDAELERLLKEGFNAVLAPLNAEERAGMNYQSWKDSSREAREITNKYNADKIKKGTAPEPEGPTPLTESERKKQMTALGYTVAEMNVMSADDVNKILAEKRKKRIYVDTLKGEMNFDEFPPMLDYIDDVIDEAYLKLQSENFELTPDKKLYMKFDPLTGRPIPGSEHKRVSDVVKTKADGIPEEAADRGNIIDLLLRDFLNRTIRDTEKFKAKYEEYRAQNPLAGVFSEKMLDDLFDKFRTVELFIKQKGLNVRANMPTLSGLIGGTRVAGTIDLLAFDAAGNVYIIDLKTSTSDRRMQYKLEEKLEQAFGAEWPAIKEVIRASKGDLYKAENRVSAEQKAKLKAISDDPAYSSNIKKYKGVAYFPIYFYKSEDARQQNAYMELLKQSTGIVAANTLIFPLLLSKTNGIYTSVDFQKEDGNHTMAVKKYDIHEDMGLENQVKAYPENPLSKEKLNEFRETPEEEPTPTPTPTPQPTGEIDIVNTPSQEIIDELNKLGSINEKLEWLKNNNLIAPITIGGKSYNVIDYSDRVMVLMKIGKYNIPFYISTGQAGKKNVKAGNWYIVFGIGREGWINKGSEEEINKQYDNPAFQKFARILNESIGKIVSREDEGNGKIKDGIGFLDDSPAAIAEFNAQMNLPTEPAPNYRSPDVFYNHVNSTLGLVNEEIKALKKEPVQTPVNRAAEIKRKIEALEDKIKILYRFKSDTDSNAAVVQAEKDIAKYEEQLKKLQEELDALEGKPAGGQPTSTSTDIETKKADIERRRKEDLKQITRTVIYGTNENGEIDINTTLTIGRGEPIQLDDIENKDEIIISDGNYVGRARRNSKGLWDYKIGAGGLFDLNDQELFEQFQRQKIRNGNIISTFKYNEELSALEGQPTKELTLNDIKPGDKFTDIKIGYQATVTSVTKDGIVFYDTDKVSGDMPFDEFIKAFVPSNKSSAEKNTEQTIADLRAREQVELHKAIPNIDDYPDTYGEKQGNMPGVLYGIYKVIYDKYDKLITDASGAKPKSGTGTQTQMDFDELTLNVGDRVKVNTPKDGEGIIKEDRGDKVLLEDGRQVMKKSLTKLEPVDNEPVTSQSTIPDALRGKVIFVTPTKATTTMLSGMPGVTYGSDVYLDIILSGFNDAFVTDLINASQGATDSKVKEAATELLDVIDRYNSPAKDVSTADVRTINGALTRLTNQTASQNLPASFITKLKKIQSIAWTKTMNQARDIANTGQTVIFDLSNAAASGKIDIALLSSTSDLGPMGYNYDKAIAGVKSKSFNITGKNIIDILNGTVDLEFFIPEALKNLRTSINEAGRKEFDTINILLSNLPKGVYDQLLQDQSLTQESLDKIIQDKKNKLATTFTIDDLVVNESNPMIVQYTINEITGKQEFGGQGRKQGVVIGNDGLRVRIAEFVPGLSFADLEESKNVVTFTAKEVPYFIVPLKPQTPTTVDPDVNSQSDAMMNDPVSDPGTSMNNLKTDLESTKDMSAADVLASFKKNQKCKK